MTIPSQSDHALATPQTPQRFLLLQGPPSGFARHLGGALQRAGHEVRRVNFCTGDWIFWHDDRALNFKGFFNEWELYLDRLIERENITCILYFADRLPYHRVAAKVARKRGIPAVSYEFGYLRPDWIVIERNGQSLYSHFPNDLELIRRQAEKLDSPDMRLLYPFSFVVESSNEILFNLSNYFLWYFFPRYQSDKFYNPLVEYLSYIPRLIKGQLRKKKAEDIVENVIGQRQTYFVVPLQMQNDYQIRQNSNYPHMRLAINQIMRSFLKNAEPDAKLIFKMHPLDNGLERWNRFIAKRATALKLKGRVFFVDGGNLRELLVHAKGTITINSTTGLHALQVGCPVKVLGIAVYDMPGLTHQGPLHGFWRNPLQPNRQDVEALVKLMAAGIHVKGNFYSKKGMDAAAKAFVDRLTSGRINAEGTFIDPQPRLAMAQDMGILIDPPT